MKEGEAKYYNAKLTLNRLVDSTINQSEISSSKFGIKLILEKDIYHYGTQQYYEIDIYCDGIMKDIEINNYTISYIVDLYVDIVRSHNREHNYYTYKGINPEGESFELKLSSDYGNNPISQLKAVIIGIILISETKDLNKVSLFWKFLFDKYDIKVGDSISLIEDLNPIISKIVEKYPFLKDELKERVYCRIQSIKNQLEKLEWLK